MRERGREIGLQSRELAVGGRGKGREEGDGAGAGGGEDMVGGVGWRGSEWRGSVRRRRRGGRGGRGEDEFVGGCVAGEESCG